MSQVVEGHMALSTSVKSNTYKKLFSRRAKFTLWKNLFAFRTVKQWNGLPQSVIYESSINSFKNRLDKNWSNQDILCLAIAKLLWYKWVKWVKVTKPKRRLRPAKRIHKIPRLEKDSISK